MEGDNDILIEDFIVKAISVNKVIYGTTATIFDTANIFGKIVFKENQNQNWSTGNT